MPSEKYEAGKEGTKSWGKILAKRVRDGLIFYLSGRSSQGWPHLLPLRAFQDPLRSASPSSGILNISSP